MPTFSRSLRPVPLLQLRLRAMLTLVFLRASGISQFTGHPCFMTSRHGSSILKHGSLPIRAATRIDLGSPALCLAQVSLHFITADHCMPARKSGLIDLSSMRNHYSLQSESRKSASPLQRQCSLMESHLYDRHQIAGRSRLSLHLQTRTPQKSCNETLQIPCRPQRTTFILQSFMIHPGAHTAEIMINS